MSKRSDEVMSMGEEIEERGRRRVERRRVERREGDGGWERSRRKRNAEIGI